MNALKSLAKGFFVSAAAIWIYSAVLNFKHVQFPIEVFTQSETGSKPHEK
jgi:hypothetical protein